MPGIVHLSPFSQPLTDTLPQTPGLHHLQSLSSFSRCPAYLKGNKWRKLSGWEPVGVSAQLSPFSSPGGLIESCSDPHSLLSHLEGPESNQGRQAQDSLSPCTAPKLKAVSVAQPGSRRPRGKWEGKERQMGQSLLVTAQIPVAPAACVQETCGWAAPQSGPATWRIYLISSEPEMSVSSCHIVNPPAAVGLTIISYSSVDRY